MGLGRASRRQRRHLGVDGGALGRRQHIGHQGAQAVEPRGVPRLQRGHIEPLAPRAPGEPEGGAPQPRDQPTEKGHLARRRNLQVQRLHVRPERLEAQRLLGGFVAGGERDDVAPRGRHGAGRKAGSAAVDHVVGHHRRDDVGPEPVGADRRLPGLARLLGEIGLQALFQERVGGRPAGDDHTLQLQLAVGEQDGELGARQAAARLEALGDLRRVGQAFHGPVEASGMLQVGHEARMRVEFADRVHLQQRQRQGLFVVVTKDMGGHVVGHRLQDRVAAAAGELALTFQHAGGDLDVHLVVRGIHTRRVVDRVGVDTPARFRELDAAGLRQPQVRALADHLHAQLVAVDAHGVVGLVAGVHLGLVTRLHIGADAAQIEQLGRRLEDQVDDLGGRQRLGLRPQEGADFGAERNGFQRPGEDAAALADPGPVVIVPRGPRQGEEALALGVAGRRVGVGVEEDVAMVEGGLQADLARQQHAVAEHVARHVAAADDGEGLGLDVLAHLAEVTLHRLPGAAGRDAHRLVVVAGRPARGEGVAQPEAVGFGQCVGDVREGGRALVGRHHEVGIVAIVGDHRVGTHHLAGGVQVVGEVQQARQEGRVGGDRLGAHRLG